MNLVLASQVYEDIKKVHYSKQCTGKTTLILLFKEFDLFLVKLYVSAAKCSAVVERSSV